MRACHLSFLPLLTLLACAPTDTDDTTRDEVPEVVLTQESTLADAYANSCVPDLYWPAATTHYPYIVWQVEAPAPPYDIVSFTAETWNAQAAFGEGSRGCDATLGLRVFAFLHEGTPDTLSLGDNGLPDTPVIAEAVLVGPTGGDWATVSATVELDEPIRVETEGTLWIGYDSSMDAGSGLGSCLAGCAEGDATWLWMSKNGVAGGPGWQERIDTNVLLAVDVKHN